MDFATREHYQKKIDQYLLENLIEKPPVQGLAEPLAEASIKSQNDYIQPLLLFYAGLAMGATSDHLIHVAAALVLARKYADIRKDVFVTKAIRGERSSLIIKDGCPLLTNAGDTLLYSIWRVLFDQEFKIGKEDTLDLVDEFSCMLFKNRVSKMSCFSHAKRDSLKDTLYGVDDSAYWTYLATPMRLAAIVSKEKHERIQRIFPVLDEICRDLGRAFQLATESKHLIRLIHGSLTEESTVCFDRSLFFCALLDRITEKQKNEIRKIVTKAPQKCQDRELRRLYQTIKSSGGFELALRTFDSWTHHALYELDASEFVTDRRALQELQKLLKEILLTKSAFLRSEVMSLTLCDPQNFPNVSENESKKHELSW